MTRFDHRQGIANLAERGLRARWTTKRKRVALRLAVALAFIGSGWLIPPALAAEGQTNPLAGDEIPAEQFRKFHALISPKPGGFDEVPWMTSLWAAARRRQRKVSRCSSGPAKGTRWDSPEAPASGPGPGSCGTRRCGNWSKRSSSPSPWTSKSWMPGKTRKGSSSGGSMTAALPGPAGASTP